MSGAAFCWGYNYYGQLGDGTTTNRLMPVAVSTTAVSQFASGSLVAGYLHTCGLSTSGGAFCWGQNNNGQIGNGFAAFSLDLISVATRTMFASGSLVAGYLHTCGLDMSGAAFCWGYNYYGQLGDGTFTNRMTPVAVSTSIVSRFVSGSLVAGFFHTCGLSASGAAFCWGSNDDRQLGDGTFTNRMTPVAVSTSVVPQFASGSLVAGSYHTCGLSMSGAAFCWGNNAYGKLGDGTTTSRPTPVAVSTSVVSQFAGGSLVAGNQHTCGLSTTGAAFCWGSNDYGQLGDNTTTSRLTPIAVSTTIVSQFVSGSLIAGFCHTCGLTISGAAFCWGNNDYGQLGDGTTTTRLTPVAVSTTVVTQFASGSLVAGSYHTCGLSISGAAFCWGSNDYGQLGDGSNKFKLTPTAVSTTVVFQFAGGSLAAGADYTCGLNTSGAAFCWGFNGYGQLGNSRGTYEPLPVLVVSPQPAASRSLSPSTSQTLSQTPSQSQSQASSTSQTLTASTTLSPSSSATASLTVTPSTSPSFTASRTSSLTSSSSASPSATRTASCTVSPTTSMTPSLSMTASASSSSTARATPSATTSPTHTRTRSSSQTQTSSSTLTATCTASQSQSPSAQSTTSQSPSQATSGTGTPSGSQEQTSSATASPTSTQSRSQIATASASPSFSATASSSRTPSQMQSQSASGTPTLTQTASAASSPSPTSTPSATRTPSESTSRSATPSQTQSASQSASATQRETLSRSQTRSPTQTQSGTASPAQTPSQSPTASQTQSVSRSQTQSETPSRTQTQLPTPSVTQSPTLTPVGPVIFDSTLFASAPVQPASSLLLNAQDAYSIAFSLAEGDPACGPGTWSLTQLVVAMGQAPGGGTTANLVASLYTADTSSGEPASPIAARAIVGLYLPATPSYVTLPLSALRFDTVGALGPAYALVLTTDAPVVLYAADTGASGNVPSPGKATALASLASADGGATWAPALPYVGELLYGYKLSCSATVSPSTTVSRTPSLTQSGTQTCTRSRSGTGTRSQTETQTRSVTRSLTRTPSSTESRTRSRTATRTQSGTGSGSASATQSSTPSESASQAPTPSVTASASSTPSGSASLSGTPSATATQTQSASVTGFPEQAALDWTGGGAAAIEGATALPLGPDAERAAALFWPEADPACGPGRYTLTALSLALSLDPDSGGVQPAALVVSLLSASPGGSPGTPLRTAVLAPLPGLSATPAFVRLALPGGWVVDALASPWVALSFYTDSHVRWHVVAGAGGALPAFAELLGTFVSGDGGVSWAPDAPSSAGSPGLGLWAVKLGCSPTPSPSHSRSGSRSPSRSATPSAAGTRSRSGSRSQAPTPSRSLTQSQSGSQSGLATATASGTRSAAATRSGSPTPSRTASASGSGTRSGSPSSSGTKSGSPSGSATPSESRSQAPTRSPSPTRSASPSRSPSPAPSPSRSPTPSCTGSPAGSSSGSRSPSASRSPSRSGSGSGSGTRSATASASASASTSAERTRSDGGTPSPTQSKSGGSPSASETGSGSQSAAGVGTTSGSGAPGPTRSASEAPASPLPASSTSSGTGSPTGSPSGSRSSSPAPSPTVSESAAGSALPGEPGVALTLTAFRTGPSAARPWVLTVPLALALRRSMAAAFNVSTRAIALTASSEAPSGATYAYTAASPVNADDGAYRRLAAAHEREQVGEDPGLPLRALQQASASASPPPALPSTVTVSVVIVARTGGGPPAALLPSAISRVGSGWLRSFVEAHPDTFGGEAAAADAAFVGSPSLISAPGSSEGPSPTPGTPLPLAGLIGVAVAAAVLAALCCIGVAWLLLRRRRRQKGPSPQKQPRGVGTEDCATAADSRNVAAATSVTESPMHRRSLSEPLHAPSSGGGGLGPHDRAASYVVAVCGVPGMASVTDEAAAASALPPPEAPQLTVIHSESADPFPPRPLLPVREPPLLAVGGAGQTSVRRGRQQPRMHAAADRGQRDEQQQQQQQQQSPRAVFEASDPPAHIAAAAPEPARVQPQLQAGAAEVRAGLTRESPAAPSRPEISPDRARVLSSPSSSGSPAAVSPAQPPAPSLFAVARHLRPLQSPATAAAAIGVSWRSVLASSARLGGPLGPVPRVAPLVASAQRSPPVTSEGAGPSVHRAGGVASVRPPAPAPDPAVSAASAADDKGRARDASPPAAALLSSAGAGLTRDRAASAARPSLSSQAPSATTSSTVHGGDAPDVVLSSARAGGRESVIAPRASANADSPPLSVPAEAASPRTAVTDSEAAPPAAVGRLSVSVLDPAGHSACDDSFDDGGERSEPSQYGQQQQQAEADADYSRAGARRQTGRVIRRPDYLPIGDDDRAADEPASLAEAVPSVLLSPPSPRPQPRFMRLTTLAAQRVRALPRPPSPEGRGGEEEGDGGAAPPPLPRHGLGATGRRRVRREGEAAASAGRLQPLTPTPASADTLSPPQSRPARSPPYAAAAAGSWVGGPTAATVSAASTMAERRELPSPPPRPLLVRVHSDGEVIRPLQRASPPRRAAGGRSAVPPSLQLLSPGVLHEAHPASGGSGDTLPPHQWDSPEGESGMRGSLRPREFPPSIMFPAGRAPPFEEEGAPEWGTLQQQQAGQRYGGPLVRPPHGA